MVGEGVGLKNCVVVDMLWCCRSGLIMFLVIIKFKFFVDLGNGNFE